MLQCGPVNDPEDRYCHSSHQLLFFSAVVLCSAFGSQCSFVLADMLFLLSFGPDNCLVLSSGTQERWNTVAEINSTKMEGDPAAKTCST